MAVTQAQIAELAGVSRATVDRVVNNRGKVDPEVEERIRGLIAEMGYQHNKAGSMLARSKNPVHLGVIIQSVETPFLNCVYNEIERKRMELERSGVKVTIKGYEGLNTERQLMLIEELMESGIQGLAITPTEDERISFKLDELNEKGIPVVTFNTDMPYTRRLCYVGQDPYMSGRLCAGLMNILVGSAGKILLITGNFYNLSHRRRIEGFQSESRAIYSGIQLLPMERCNDNDQEAHDIVCKMVEQDPEIKGIYLSSNGQLGVCAALREKGLQSRIRFVCHDMYPGIEENILDGTIDFTIDQDAESQAIRPLDILLDFVLTGAKPKDEFQLIRNEIICKYNIR